MGAFLGWKTGTARAQADAEHLRFLYGQDAEAWCLEALGAMGFGDPRRGEIRRIMKALRAMPASESEGAGRAVNVPSPRIVGVWRRT